MKAENSSESGQRGCSAGRGGSWVSLDPLGQRQEGFISVDVFISIVYILPAIGGLYFSWVLHLKLYISCQKIGGYV